MRALASSRPEPAGRGSTQNPNSDPCRDKDLCCKDQNGRPLTVKGRPNQEPDDNQLPADAPRRCPCDRNESRDRAGRPSTQRCRYPRREPRIAAESHDEGRTKNDKQHETNQARDTGLASVDHLSAPGPAEPALGMPFKIRSCVAFAAIPLTMPRTAPVTPSAPGSRGPCDGARTRKLLQSSPPRPAGPPTGSGGRRRAPLTLRPSGASGQ